MPHFKKYIDKHESDYLLRRAIFSQEWQRLKEIIIDILKYLKGFHIKEKKA